MKYFLKVFVFAAAISVMGGNSSFASRVHPAIYINNEKLDLSASVTWLGTTLVPMRPIFEQYGMSVTWDNVNKSVTATKDGITIKLTHNSNDAYVNGEKKVLTQVPTLDEHNTFYVNLRFISEALGASVNWKKTADDASIYINFSN